MTTLVQFNRRINIGRRPYSREVAKAVAGLGVTTAEIREIEAAAEAVRWALQFTDASPARVARAAEVAKMEAASKILARHEAAVAADDYDAAYGPVPPVVRRAPSGPWYERQLNANEETAEAQEIAELGSQVGHYECE